MSGAVYLVAALVLEGSSSPMRADLLAYQRPVRAGLFVYSIVYLAALFAALLVDHISRFSLAASSDCCSPPAAVKRRSSRAPTTGAGVRQTLALDRPHRASRGAWRLSRQGGVLFFGFTHCRRLSDHPGRSVECAEDPRPDAERVQVLFVTVTPSGYAGGAGEIRHRFDPRFLGCARRRRNQRVAKEFKIYFEKRKAGETYSVDHSGQSYVIVRRAGCGCWSARPIAQDLPADLRTLLRG